MRASAARVGSGLVRSGIEEAVGVAGLPATGFESWRGRKGVAVVFRRGV